MLHDTLARDGNWLFRWRGVLPFLILPLIALAFDNMLNTEAISPRMTNATEFLGLAISVMGLALRCLVVGYAAPGTSGRNTRGQRADSLNTDAAYALMRHPLYLANYLILLGILLITHTVWLIVIVTLAYTLYYERIMLREEQFLVANFGDDFRRWASRTPAIFPRLTAWRRPDRPFSWRRISRSEYGAVLVIAIGFGGIEGAEWLAAGDPSDLVWVIASAIAILAALTPRAVKKTTSWLDH